jgi:hypothetical protein
MAFLTQNKAKICKILIITLVLEKNAIFFAENCDHNIGPWRQIFIRTFQTKSIPKIMVCIQQNAMASKSLFKP